MMKRMFLVLVIALAMIVLPTCGKRGPYNSSSNNTVATQPTTPKAPERMEPDQKPSTVVVTPPKTVRPPVKRPPRIAVAPKNEPAPVPGPETKSAPKSEPTPPIATPETHKAPPARPKATVSIVDYWLVRSPSALSSDLYAITFVVRNTASRAVRVKVVCNHADGSLFGESIPQEIDAKSDAKLMVRGFRRCPDDVCRETMDCRVEAAR